MSIATFERQTFTTSRMLDFFTRKSLSAETGISPDEWPLMIVKELIDNALDACESTTTPPTICITAGDSNITVSDNGPGLPVETLKASLDFSTRTSSNARIISPSRGSQGNALKTILAAAYVLSDDGRGFVHVSTNGRGFNIEIATDPIRQEPSINLTEVKPKCKKGTLLKVELPCQILDRNNDVFLQIGFDYACLNPHATLKIEASGQQTLYQAMAPDWKKWLTSAPTSAHWYDQKDLESLVAAHVAHDGGNLAVRQFIGTFDGFAGSAKQKRVLDQTELARKTLADFVQDGDLDSIGIGRLLASMKELSRPIKSKKLGVIGEGHFRQRFRERGGDDELFKYKCIAGIEAGQPYVIEAAFSYMPEWDDYGCSGDILAGINWAPGISRLPLQLGSRWSLDGLLEDCRATTDEPILLCLHMATPKVAWLDRGKSRASLDGDFGEALKSAVQSVSREWKKRRDAEDRAAISSRRRADQLRKQKAGEQTTLKDAILLEIPNAIAEVSGGGEYPFQDRAFYYAIRPRVQRHGVARLLTQKYFDSIVEQWEAQHGVIELRYRDPRGHLVEPHTGEMVPLGTAEVNNYDLPDWLFHTVLFIEKKGFAPLFQKSRLAEKYDIAIVSSEGYAVDAAKTLLARAQQEQEITILCLHDADPYGKNIARSLRKATLRSKSIHVIDIGLNLDDALEMNLPTEDFERQRKLPRDLDLTAIELEHFNGSVIRYNKNGKPVYRCQRVELNALAANPSAFIAYVEQQLEKHGCGCKLVPPDEVVRDHATDERHKQVLDAVRTTIQRSLNVESMTRKIAKNLVEHVEVIDMPDFLDGWESRLHPESWKGAVQAEIEKRVIELHPQIAKAVKESVSTR